MKSILTLLLVFIISGLNAQNKHTNEIRIADLAGNKHIINSLIRIDGVTKQLSGSDKLVPKRIFKKSEKNQLMATIFTFTDSVVELEISFIFPNYPSEIQLLRKPAIYTQFSVRSVDKKAHNVQLYFDFGTEWVCPPDTQLIDFEHISLSEMSALSMDASSAGLLLGYTNEGFSGFGGNLSLAKKEFLKDGFFAEKKEPNSSGKGNTNDGIALCFDAGSIQNSEISNHFIIAFDELYSIEYQTKKLRTEAIQKLSIQKQIISAENDFANIIEANNKIFNKIQTDAIKVGDSIYSKKCVEAYRNTMQNSYTVLDDKGLPLSFYKNNNNILNHIESLYEIFPMILVFNTEIARSLLEPIFGFRENARWFEPFAPSNVGYYPFANGQVGNQSNALRNNSMMILMTAGIVNAEKSNGFAKRHSASLREWANYLNDNILDMSTTDSLIINALTAYKNLEMGLNKVEIPNFQSDTRLFSQFISRGISYSPDTLLHKWNDTPLPLSYMQTLMYTSENQRQMWKYSLQLPSGNWWEKDFDEKKWVEGLAPFANDSALIADSVTTWNTTDIWLRRKFEIETDKLKDIRLFLRFDSEIEVFLNGIPAIRIYSPSPHYQIFDVDKYALKALKKGENTIAIHCSKGTGHQFVDAGLILIVEK